MVIDCKKILEEKAYSSVVTSDKLKTKSRTKL